MRRYIKPLIISIITILFLCLIIVEAFYAYDYMSSTSDARPSNDIHYEPAKPSDIQKSYDELSVIPSIYINTVPIDSIDHDEYSDATYTIADKDGEILKKCLYGRIHGRGNSTWNMLDAHNNKRAYKIKFNKKQDLFGFGEAKDYILLANTFDNTLLRNELAYSLGTALGVAYTTECMQISVYINGIYNGVYLLCEQTESGKSRVDIENELGDESSDEVDVGYLVEYGGSPEKNDFELTPVKNSMYNWDPNFRGEIMYPDEDALTPERIEYVSTYLNAINQAILLRDWTRITELVDISSTVDVFLTNSIMLSGDMGWCTYMYKPRGEKFHFGPIWDFDQSSANSTFGGTTYEGWDSDNGSPNRWFLSLIEIPEFKELVKARFIEKEKYIKNLPQLVLQKAAIYKYDFNKNYELWDIIGKPRWRIPKDILELETYDENVAYLSQWLTNRIAWISKDLNIE